MRSWIFCLFLAALALSVGGAECRAESEHEESPGIGSQPIRGRFYYVIHDLTAKRIVRRGVSDVDGDIHQGLLLPAGHRYREGFLHARTLKFGFSEFVTPGPGESFRFPNTTFRDPNPAEPDTDSDGISDLAEFIVGTDPEKADSDADGLPDGAEVHQGTNPLDSNPPVSGLIAQADTPGEAQDVDASNDLVALATGLSGVSVFNVGAGSAPVLRSQVDTGGSASRVAIGNGFLSAAAGSAGAVILIPSGTSSYVGYTHPPTPGSECRAIAAADSLAFAGFSDGKLGVLGVRSDGFTVLQSLKLPGGDVRDLFLAGDYLFALVGDTLQTLRLEGAELEISGSAASPVYQGPASARLFVGGDVAYVVHGKGYNTFDVSNPASPRLIKSQEQPEFGWKHLVANGTGLGLVTASPNASFDGPHKVRLYDVSNPSNVSAFLNQYDTLGVARAVSLYNGLAYVAFTKGLGQPANGPSLQVLSYLAADTLKQPPGIALAAGFPLTPNQTGSAESGKLARVTALVTDDVQVRDVSFFVDGALVARDGNFPFEARFVTPLRSESKTNFVLYAVATDTGGNTTRTADITVELTGDTTAPRMIGRSPEPDSFQSSVDAVAVRFNEPILPESVNLASFQIARAGADGQLGTADDVLLSNATYQVISDANLAVASLAGAPFVPDFYEARILKTVKDISGNAIAAALSWRFIVGNEGQDSDGDGISDYVERAMELSPFNKGDAQADLDGDGIGTLTELRLGLNPRLADSNGDGVRDDAEDSDGDNLDNRTEVQRGTDIAKADTDGDGFQDGDEVASDSDPLSALSIPFIQRISQPASVLNAAPDLPTLFDRFTPGVSYRNQ